MAVPAGTPVTNPKTTPPCHFGKSMHRLRPQLIREVHTEAGVPAGQYPSGILSR